MLNESRSKNFIRNTSFGIGTQIVQTILPFISRTIFIHQLGASYLGIGGLFTSILSVLSLADLGLGSVVIYSLYKPVAENDNVKIASLIKFYKKIYNYIAGIVLVIGVALLPFLGFMINLPEELPHVRFYYILYVLNSSISYLYVYKTSLIRANQKNYIISLYTTVCNVLMNAVQIIGLIIVPNFTIYLVIQVAFTFIQNFLLSRRAEKMYQGQLMSKTFENSVEIESTEKRKIFSDAKAMLSYKVGGVLLNSIDSILISALVSTITVGFYSNYLTLENFLNKFINIIYDSFLIGAGNLNAVATDKKKKQIFDVFRMVFNSIAIIGTVGILVVCNDLIILWLGNDYLIDFSAMVAFAFKFFLPIVLYPVWIYRNTTGLFKETQNILFYTGILNLFLSIVLGKLFGLTGILAATVIARILTSFWFEPVILYRKRFSTESSSFEYFRDVIMSVLLIFLSVFFIEFFIRCINADRIVIIAVKVLLCVTVPVFFLVLYYRNTDAFNYVVVHIQSRVNNDK